MLRTVEPVVISAPCEHAASNGRPKANRPSQQNLRAAAKGAREPRSIMNSVYEIRPVAPRFYTGFSEKLAGVVSFLCLSRAQREPCLGKRDCIETQGRKANDCGNCFDRHVFLRSATSASLIRGNLHSLTWINGHRGWRIFEIADD